jgi:PAS domain S-box-containing protein
MEKKSINQMLMTSVDFTDAILDSIPDVIGIQDLNHRIIRYNAAGYLFLGRTPENTIGRKCYELIGRSSPCHVCATVKVYQTRKPARVEKYVDDIDKWIDVRAYPVYDDNGEVSQVIEHIRDISREKVAELRLSESHERMIAILNSIDSSIYVTDINTYEIIFMNRQMIEDFGRDCTGEVCWQAFRNESSPCSHCTNDQLIDPQGNPGSVSVWQDQNPITKKFYINHDRTIKWTDGRSVKLQVATDITDYKKMEEQLSQAQKMEAIGTLAGGIAHDFNNMLTVILGYAQSGLSAVDASHPLYYKFQQILNAASRSADITRQLLAFARKQTISPKILDLNLTLEGMLNILHRLIGEDIDLSWKPALGLWPVKMDSSQIDQILANLCVNARDAISGVGKLTIETGMKTFDTEYCADHASFIPGDFVMLAVSDNGCGIHKEILNNLFDPFFTTKDVGKGTGLGLATVYGIVKQNNGFINVYSEPGQGTTFRIYLPRYHHKEDESTVQPTEKISFQGFETILLVEDEPMILEMTTEMLEAHGYTVLGADRPGEAIRIANAHAGDIHLLMTDVVLPEMNGRDLAENLSAFYPDLKLLFMSGYTANVIAHQGVLDEGVAFIQKPFSVADLAEKLREVLDETQNPA